MIEHSSNQKIESARFKLRPLVENDATDEYLGWLNDRISKQYISFAKADRTLNDLQSYIKENNGKDNVLFLGIFEKITSKHIGNIKFDPVDSKHGYAVMGILIGDEQFRGVGVAAEVLDCTAKWLKANLKIHQILLGVHADNSAAITAYKKVGFVASDSEYLAKSQDSITMIWNF